MGKFKHDPSFKPRGRGPKKFAGRRDSDSSERRDDRRPSRFDGRRDDRPERTQVTCDSCKKKCEVPFKPTSNKPVYCDDCFKKTPGSKSSNYSKDFEEINQKLDKIMKALKINQEK